MLNQCGEQCVESVYFDQENGNVFQVEGGVFLSDFESKWLKGAIVEPVQVSQGNSNVFEIT